MRQVFQDVKTGTTFISDVPAPKPRPGELLVRVGASAVSVGTERMVVEFASKNLLSKARSRPDLVRRVLDKARRDGILAAWEAAHRRLSEPLPLGYSCAGTVVETGGDTGGLKPGDRVACGGAGYASHAEFVSVPRNLCAPLPPGSALSDEEASFATVSSIALQGFRLGSPEIGDAVAVIGLGLLGQITVQLARAAGCRVFGIDTDPDRAGLAGRNGADMAVTRPEAESAARRFFGPAGADVVIVTADTRSNDPVELAGVIARDRAAVVLVGAVGTTFPRDLYFKKELSLRVSRSYGPGRYDPVYEEGGIDYPRGFVRWTEGRNIEEALRLMDIGRLKIGPLITNQYPISDAAAAYDLLRDPSGPKPLGIVLQYPDRAEPRRKIPAAGAGRRPKSRIVVGAIGSGAFAKSVFFPIVKGSGAELGGVASSGGGSAADVARRFGFSFSTTEADQVIGDSRVNAVAVINRHNLHAATACAALAEGKHVFVEKPLCLDLRELEAVRNALDEAGGPGLFTGFNRRFAPMTSAIVEHFKGSSPKSVSIRVNAGVIPPDHWLLDPRTGGGRLLGEGCHFIHWANFIVGARVESVVCFPLGDAPGEQDWALQIAYVDGSCSSIQYTSFGATSAGKERFEVHAGNRSAVLEDFNRLTLMDGPRSRTSRTWLRSDKGHRNCWSAFLEACRSGDFSVFSWEEISEAMRTVFAARESLRTGVKTGLQ